MSSKKEDQKVVLLENEKDKKTIYRVCKNKNNPYVMLNKGFLEDPNISLKSKGLLSYLLSKPDDWIVYREEILKHCTDGKDSLQSSINELKRVGYIQVVPIRNEKGKVITWHTLVFEIPQPTLHIVPNPESENPNLVKTKIHPDSGNPDSGFSRSGKPATTNNDLVLSNKNTNNKLAMNPQPEPQKPTQNLDPSVVASLLEQLQQWAIAETLIRTWLKRYSAEYILEKIEYTKAHSTTNPAGFLRKAIENDYCKHPSNNPKPEQKPPVEAIWPSHEENLDWYAALSNEDKQKCFSEATHRHAHFEEMLKIEKVDFKSVNFLKSHWFKMMMQILRRAR